jgi:hypothetical protein
MTRLANALGIDTMTQLRVVDAYEGSTVLVTRITGLTAEQIEQLLGSLVEKAKSGELNLGARVLEVSARKVDRQGGSINSVDTTEINKTVDPVRKDSDDKVKMSSTEIGMLICAIAIIVSILVIGIFVVNKIRKDRANNAKVMDIVKLEKSCMADGITGREPKLPYEDDEDFGKTSDRYKNLCIDITKRDSPENTRHGADTAAISPNVHEPHFTAKPFSPKDD